jgi:hypothetical protein
MRELNIIDGFKSIFISCCFLQLLLPIVAVEIRREIEKHGIEMQANPYTSLFKMTQFWSEAKSLNRKLNNQKVKLLICSRDLFCWLAFASFMVFALF